MKKFIIIRKATIKDVSSLADLGTDLMLYHQKLDSYFTMAKNTKNIYKQFFKKCVVDKKRILLVAEFKNTIVGYALGSLKLRPPVVRVRRVGRINDMFVQSDFRHQKIGQRLFTMLIDWFKSKQIKYVDLGVHINNKTGIRAWKKYKFKTFLLEQKIVI